MSVNFIYEELLVAMVWFKLDKFVSVRYICSAVLVKVAKQLLPLMLHTVSVFRYTGNKETVLNENNFTVDK